MPLLEFIIGSAFVAALFMLLDYLYRDKRGTKLQLAKRFVLYSVSLFLFATALFYLFGVDILGRG